MLIFLPPAGCFKITSSFGLGLRFMSSTGSLWDLSVQNSELSWPQFSVFWEGFVRFLVFSLFFLLYLPLELFKTYVITLSLSDQKSKQPLEHPTLHVCPPPFCFTCLFPLLLRWSFLRRWSVSTVCRPAELRAAAHLSSVRTCFPSSSSFTFSICVFLSFADQISSSNDGTY